MDKRMKRKILTLYSNGMNAHDITIQHNLDPRAEYIVTTMEIEDLLREMRVADPNRRIPQKPEIQPDMPKRFISINESQKQRGKHRMKKVELTATQREWHNIACGFAQGGRKLLKSSNRHALERQIVEHLERGYVQLGNITSDFDYDGPMFFAVVKKGDFDDAR